MPPSSSRPTHPDPPTESANLRAGPRVESAQSDALWVDEEAGPVVRHYAVTQGRTRPTRGEFDLITLVSATPAASGLTASYAPEHLVIVDLCQRPTSVAEIANHLDLPIGTVRVMLGDLLDHGMIRTRSPVPATTIPSERVFKAVLDGLRSL